MSSIRIESVEASTDMKRVGVRCLMILLLFKMLIKTRLIENRGAQSQHRLTFEHIHQTSVLRQV